MSRAVGFCCLLAGASALNGCGMRARPNLTLPTGPGVPLVDYAAPLASAVARCRNVTTFSAELALSGHAGRQKLRGRVLIGLAGGAMRIEALAPAGSPVFIFVADGEHGRLLLARDRRTLEGAPAEILDALVGVALGPDDLRPLLAGCLRPSVEPAAARAYGTDWIAIDVVGGDTVHLRRDADGGWRIVAGSLKGLNVQYGPLLNGAPSLVHIAESPSSGSSTVDLSMALSQVDINGDLPHDSLVAIAIPRDTSPMTLEELRESAHR